MKVFVTGGAGYVGSHTLLELLDQADKVCVCDNFCNSSPEALRRVRRLAKRTFDFFELDIRDQGALTRALKKFKPDVVVHFAGLKAVGQSSITPLDYYDNNVLGSLTLLRAMDEIGCRRIVFSSSATVYGEPAYLPLDEAHPRNPTNPYGRTKLMVEEIIQDWTAISVDRSAAILRYFNPAGAHPSGEIGEDPNGTPSNLMPFITQIATGRLPLLRIYGNDYPTSDGTGERDYIHVVDLARAHLASVNYVFENNGSEAFNIGTGRALSVMQILAAFEAASGRKISFEIAERRQGDIATSVASVGKAQATLGWCASHSIEEICASSWNWQVRNPAGYVRTKL